MVLLIFILLVVIGTLIFVKRERIMGKKTKQTPAYLALPIRTRARQICRKIIRKSPNISYSKLSQIIYKMLGFKLADLRITKQTLRKLKESARVRISRLDLEVESSIRS